MSDTLDRIKKLTSQGDIRISDHGYDELAADGILARNVVNSLQDAILIEDYPDYPKGPCVLLLSQDDRGTPIHAVWGIPKGLSRPAVLVTAYRPQPDLWSDDFRSRKK